MASGLHDVDTELLLLCFFRQRAGRPRMYISFFQPERSKKRNGCRRQNRAATLSLHDAVFCIPHGATARTTRHGCLCSSNATRSMIDWHWSCAGIPHGAVRKRQEVEDHSLVASGLHDVDTELLLLCFFRQRAGRPRMYISFFQPERSRKRNGCRRQHRAAMSGAWCKAPCN